MPKVTLTEATEIQDPLLSDNYELLFPELPSTVTGGADATSSLRIQCRSASKPGANIEEQLVEVFGHTLRHAGRRTVTGSFNVGFVENSTMDTYTILEQWADACRTMEEQLGQFKQDYSVTCEFIIYRQDGSVAKRYEIIGVWPKVVPELPFENTAQALQVEVEFSFDDYRELS